MIPIDTTAKSSPLSRRDLLAAGAALAVSAHALSFSRPAAAEENDLSGIKALVFDVIGTCTDHRGTIVHEGQAINHNKSLDIDWGKFADDWRGLFPPNFEAVLKGQRPWQSFASLRLEALENLVRQRGNQRFQR